MAAAREAVRIVGGAGHARRTVVTGEFGQEIKVDYETLHAYCWRNPRRVDVDLLLVAATIAYADRRVLRKRSLGWVREIGVTVPVYEVDRWESADVKAALVDALFFLTGDKWSFTFAHRKDEDRALQLRFTPPHNGHPVVLPYSGGLDSFAELRRQVAQNPHAAPFVITTKSRGIDRSQTEGTIVPVIRTPSFADVPFSLAVGPHAEQTFRTRTFMFFAVASLAWRLTDGASIVIGENGQGALGPSITSYGDEHPYRSTHPGFTRRLQIFLEKLWGSAPVFKHPHVWSTKAQVLRQLKADGISDGWRQTRSCSRTIRRHKGPSVPSECGICGNCLLRRFAVADAFPEAVDDSDYVWGNLNAETIELSSVDGVRTTKNDIRVGVHAALAHKHFAEIASRGNVESSLVRVAHEVAFGLGISVEQSAANLRGLVFEHRKEWLAFLSNLNSKSWLRNIGGCNAA